MKPEIKPDGSFSRDFIFIPYKKGKAFQYWYCFDSRKRCLEWIKQNGACWKGFKPKRYYLRISQ